MQCREMGTPLGNGHNSLGNGHTRPGEWPQLTGEWAHHLGMGTPPGKRTQGDVPIAQGDVPID
jgi:hypothetical protein